MNSQFSRQCWMVGLLIACTSHAAQFRFANQTLTVPDGFEVELVTTTKLVERPISGSFDELGRLYVTDSSGSNAKPAEQTNNPTHRVVRLEDTDGDGKFDKTVVFADKMMFPEGCLYYDGSVYVSAPPSIWKLTDTNNDGVADVRVEWHQGKTLTGCANDLHGPYLGPDGWIYWCKGAFAEQTYEVNGKPFTSRAAHIFRARPDHTGLEPVLTGGMDNPVGLTFTADGERILCGTFFVTHEPGHRDGLIHAIYGGVYGKVNSATDGHIRTGDLMPIMTHMGPAAPAAVTRYESRIFGDDYRDNLFCCQFNMHKVSRHILEPAGATFKTKDSDFLVSDNTDFHPTDVFEDADGSLLVLDTGPWYKLCCPTSQLAKPDLLGAIYRIRRKGAKKIDDPRGLNFSWATSKEDDMTKLLDDERPYVRHRTMYETAKRGKAAIPALTQALQSSRSEEARRNAIWTLTRIDAPEARAAVRYGLRPADDSAALAAIHSVSLWRDKSTVSTIQSYLAYPHPKLARVTAEALGRMHPSPELDKLLFPFACPTPPDRILEHSLIYALIKTADPKELAVFAKGGEPLVRRAAVIALDQMDNGGLKPEMVTPLLSSENASVRKSAMWIASRHPEWGPELTGYFRERLTVKKLNDSEMTELQEQLAEFAGDGGIQLLIAGSLIDPESSLNKRRMLLSAMAASELSAVPKSWPEAVRASLDQKDLELKRQAIGAARALAQMKKGAPDFSEELKKINADTALPDDLRLEALSAISKGLKSVEPEVLNFLLVNLDPAKPVAARGAAANVLVKAKLGQDDLLKLTDAMKSTGPLEVAKLLPAFEHTTNEAVGLKLIASLKESKGLSGARPDALKTLAAKYPASVQEEAEKLIASLNVDAGKQKAHIDELLATMPKGDIRNGQAIFNSPKAACSSCHKMGYGGGTVGPDLTVIGTVRTERDLLEAVVYPSASFVRSYEPFVVHTKSDEDYSGVLRKDGADEVILATGPNADVRIARSDIVEMRPGTVSVMPAGLDQLLTKQELADIVTFLKNTKWGPQ